MDTLHPGNRRQKDGQVCAMVGSCSELHDTQQAASCLMPLGEQPAAVIAGPPEDAAQGDAVCANLGENDHGVCGHEFFRCAETVDVPRQKRPAGAWHTGARTRRGDDKVLSLTDLDETQAVLYRIVSRTYHALGGRFEFEDLLQLGWVGYLEARERFDLHKGVPFGAFAYRRVRGSMLDGIGAMSGISRSRQRVLRNGATRQELDEPEDSGPVGDPDDDLLTPGCPERASQDTTWLLRAYYAPHSFDEQYPGTREEQSWAPNPEARAMEHELQDRLWEVFDAMEQDDRDLLIALYVEERSTRHLGMALGISSASVCRQHQRVIAHLRKAIEQATGPVGGRRRRRSRC